QQLIGVVEVLEKLGEEGIAVSNDGSLNAFENCGIDAFRIVRSLQQVGRNATDDHGSADVFRSVLADETGDFASTHGETDEGEFMQFQVGDNLVQIFGEGVVVVPGGGLAGIAEAAAVISDDAMAGREEHGKLLFPRGAAERISMNENYGIAGAVVLVIEFDVGRVFFSDIDVRHELLLSKVDRVAV